MANTAAASDRGAAELPPIWPPESRAWVKRLSPFVGKEGWFAVEGEYARSMVAHLTKAAKGEGGYRIPPGRWEFASRRSGDSTPERYVIWVRYLGPGDDEDGAA